MESTPVADARAPVGRSLRTLLIATALCGILFWLHHLWLIQVLRGGMKLGALHDRKFAPLYAGAGWPEYPLMVLPAAVLAAGVVVIGARFWLSGRLRGAKAGLAGVLAFIALAAAVSMVDGMVKIEGTRYPALIAPFAPTEGKHEYYWDVPIIEKVGGARELVARFHRPGVTSRLSLHGSTHPPGPILFLWGVGRAFGRSLWAAAASVVAFSGLTVLLVFALAREVYGVETARWAALLWLLTPNILMFSATSMDGPMAVLLLLTIWLYYRGLARPSAAASVAFGVGFAGAMFMTFVAAALVVVFAADWAWAARRDTFLPRLRHAAVGAAAFLAAHAVLYLTLGYQPVETLRGAIHANSELMGSNRATLAQYLNVSLANLSGFLFAVGLVLTAGFLLESVRAARDGRRDDPAVRFPLAGASALVLLAFSTLFHLELERVFLFLSPLVVIPAAAHLRARCREGRTLAPFYAAAGLAAVQLLASELYLATRW